jgi:hypothetical protein
MAVLWLDAAARGERLYSGANINLEERSRLLCAFKEGGRTS